MYNLRTGMNIQLKTKITNSLEKNPIAKGRHGSLVSLCYIKYSQLTTITTRARHCSSTNLTIDTAVSTDTSVAAGMEHTGQYLHLVFLMTTVWSSSPGTKANYTHLWANSINASDSIDQNSTSSHPSENTNLVTPAVGHKMSAKDKPASSPTVPLAPTSTPKFSTLHAFKNSSPTAEIKSQGETFKKEACENTSNTAMLICLIVIAVLFLICTFLFLSTVVLANKVSSLEGQNK